MNVEKNLNLAIQLGLWIDLYDRMLRHRPAERRDPAGRSGRFRDKETRF